jgi:hypothetical protein
MNTHSLVTRSIISTTAAALFLSMALFSYQVARADEVVDVPQEVVVVAEPAPVAEVPAPVVEEIVVPAEETPVVETTEAPAVVEEVPAPVAAAAVALVPTVTTDKEDYHPTQTATLFGSWFNSLTTYVLKIFGSDDEDQNYTESTQEVTTDETGAFSTTYVLDALYRPFYNVVVSTLAGDTVAETYFRDAAVDVYDQCQNDDGDGYATGNTGCRWTNGNLNSSNSTYQEGDSTLQRVSIKGLTPGSTHTVTLKYGTTKGGSHAYDYLTSWDASEGWSDITDRCDGIQAGCDTAPDSTAAMQNDPSMTDTIEPNPASRLFTMRGGTITGVSVPAIASGTYAGDSETYVTITYTAPNSGPMCATKGQVTSCAMVLWFGAHIANTDEWQAFNGTSGAGSINGSPYHVALADFDGDTTSAPQGGGRDNQMAASAIVVVPQSTISGVKFNDVNGDGVQDPSDAPIAGWSVTMNPGNITVQTDANGVYTFANVLDGVYTVCEVQQVGWTQTFPSTNTGNCGGGNGYSVTIANGVNTPAGALNFGNTQKARLTLVKTVVNNDGGTAADTAWTLAASGPTPISGTEGQAAVTNAAVDAGVYTLTESNGPAGYTQTGLACVGATVTNTNQITLAAGATATCTFTNDDIAPKLKLVKTVVNNNGGSATAAAFQGKIDGSNVAWETEVALTAGAHTASETNLPGYLAGAWGGDCAANGTITLAPGDVKTCTITNDDQQAYITVTKVVLNNHGGTAGPNDFNPSIDAVVVTSGVQVPVNPGVYSVGETLLSGYAITGFSGDCVADQDAEQTAIRLASIVDWQTKKNALLAAIAADPNDDDTERLAQVVDVDAKLAALQQSFTASVTVALGEQKSCTITNDDIAPLLTVIKTVVNDNGGTAVAGDFTMNVTATDVSDDSFPGDESGTTITLDAGNYSVDESPVTGYAKTLGASCTGSIAIGESKTCTITNDDIAPQLTVIKHVINNNGGTAVAADFTMKVTGADVSDTEFAGVENTGTTVTLDAGNYVVSEDSNENGYNGSFSTDCTGAIGIGESKTCTVTNDDVAPKLHLRKIVISDNGGTADVDDFTLTANGTGANDITGISPVNSGAGLQADTWALSETNLPGYIASNWVCVGGQQNGANITVGIGQEATCTITNNDTPGHFTGGGSIFPTVLGARVTHGFTLHCDKAMNPNRLQINWAGTGKGKNAENNFHLASLDTSVCTDDSSIDPQQPNADFDTITGTGTGLFNGVAGAKIWFTFNDAGEPGKNDGVKIKITNAAQTVTYLDTGLNFFKLQQGNQQAHQDN